MKMRKCGSRRRRLASILLTAVALAGTCIGEASAGSVDELPVVTLAGQRPDALLERLPRNRIVKEIPEQPHIFPLDLDAVSPEDWSWYAEHVQTSLERGGIVILTGKAQAMAAVRPAWVQVWPEGQALVLNSRWGLQVDAINAGGDASVLVGVVGDQLARLGAANPPSSDFMHPPVRSGTASPAVGTRSADFDKQVQFTIKPVSPSETCTAYGNQITQAIPPPHTPELIAALRVQLMRRCQAGTLADIAPNEPPQKMGKWRYERRIKLNLLTEWALIRSDDLLLPERSRFYFWVKTVGEGAGSGFTRAIQDTASRADNIVVGLSDMAIHIGWGRANISGTAPWTYPRPPAYWSPEDPRLFACDYRLSGETCPVNPRLVKLFPSNSFNDTVTVSTATSLAFDGTVSGTFESSTGKPVIGLQLGVTKTESVTAAAAFKLTEIATGAVENYSRTTRWRPNVAAVWDYLAAGRVEGPFGSATPTASNLNPSYDVLWTLPVEGNEGKAFNFGIVFEAGWNTCVRFTCAGVDPPPEAKLESQGRALWTRNLELKIAK